MDSVTVILSRGAREYMAQSYLKDRHNKSLFLMARLLRAVTALNNNFQARFHLILLQFLSASKGKAK